MLSVRYVTCLTRPSVSTSSLPQFMEAIKRDTLQILDVLVRVVFEFAFSWQIDTQSVVSIFDFPALPRTVRFTEIGRQPQHFFCNYSTNIMGD